MANKTQDQGFVANPARYREMNKPFPSSEAANQALEDFSKELFELRNKHRLADVLVVIGASTTYSDGEEGRFMVSALMGDQGSEEQLAEFALGQAQAARRERINKMLNGKSGRLIPVGENLVQP